MLSYALLMATTGLLNAATLSPLVLRPREIPNVKPPPGTLILGGLGEGASLSLWPREMHGLDTYCEILKFYYTAQGSCYIPTQMMVEARVPLAGIYILEQHRNIRRFGVVILRSHRFSL